jgi:IMP cyclohydrolase
MVYLGRIVGIGMTKDGIPVCVYAVSGRSDGSKARVAHNYPNRVFIGSSLTKKPYDQLTTIDKTQIKRYIDSLISYDDVSRLVKDLSDKEKEILGKQLKDEEFIFYNAIKTKNKNGIIVLSNGVHTEDIVKGRYKLEGSLQKWGPELDGPGRTPQTPRIAAVNAADTDSNLIAMGITAKPDDVSVSYPYLERGVIFATATYAGKPDAPEEMVINYKPSLFEIKTNRTSAQDLADELFEQVDKDIVVCTAAGVWNDQDNEWNLAVKNLHISE